MKWLSIAALFLLLGCDPCDNSTEACQACCVEKEGHPIKGFISGPEVSRGRISPFTICSCVEPESPTRDAVRLAKHFRIKAIRPSVQESQIEAYIQRGCYEAIDTCQACCDDWISKPSGARIVGRWDAEKNNRPKNMCLCDVDSKK